MPDVDPDTDVHIDTDTDVRQRVDPEDQVEVTLVAEFVARFFVWLSGTILLIAGVAAVLFDTIDTTWLALLVSVTGLVVLYIASSEVVDS